MRGKPASLKDIEDLGMGEEIGSIWPIIGHKTRQLAIKMNLETMPIALIAYADIHTFTIGMDICR